MSGLYPSVDPDGLIEYSVVYTDRALNHMSKRFQGVMTDISAMLKRVYGAHSAVLVPGSGTFGMESVARQFAHGKHVMVIRNGWFSFRWTQILDMGRIPASTTVLKARQIGFSTLVIGLAFYTILVRFASVNLLGAGVVLSIVFQLAHCVEEADFPMPDETTNRMEDNWMVHQINTTVDFARNSKLMCWFLGGLNFQVEHHLFPRVSHIHYPNISRIVKNACAKFNVGYNEYFTMGEAILSHLRMMRTLGKQP